MAYFILEKERKASNSTCYHEFVKGKWELDECIFWSDDSLYMHDDIMMKIGFYELLSEVIEGYSPFGIYEINKDKWEMILNKSYKYGEEISVAIKELKPWAENNFSENEVFTILGI